MIMWTRIVGVALALTPLAVAQQARPWRMLSDPAAAGWSNETLEEARRLAEASGSAAVVLVEGDVVVAAFGAIERPLRCHSVRKSLLSTLYGPHVAAGTVALDTTIAELGLDDLSPLTDAEKRATIEHLLQSSSGVFHPAAKETPAARRSRPARGSASPGERFRYNNWDFNVAGVVLERATGETLGDLFVAQLARPLGMEDVDDRTFTYQLEPRQSRHPAYAFRLSARDLARFGALVAARGRSGEDTLVPPEWLERATRAHHAVGGPDGPAGRGYGYMWWTYEPGSLASLPALAPHRVVAAIGYGGQLVAVVPSLDVVYVHRADTDAGLHVSGGDAWRIFDRLLAARGEASERTSATAPLVARPLASVRPPVEPREATEVSADVLGRTVGRFAGPGAPPAELFLHDGRLFVTVPDTFEAELFAESDDVFFARAARMTVRLERDEAGLAVAAEVEVEGQRFRAERER